MRNRMAQEKAKEKNYLVTNYDSCALTLYGTHPKLISKPLIAYTNKNHFDGFYGLSGRHYSKDIPNETYNFLDFLTHIATKKNVKSGKSIYTKKAIESNYSTCHVTENFAEATGLKCQAVSTAEDLVDGRKCGEGFDAVIKPYEMKGIDPADDMRIHVKDMTDAGINLSKSKNPLLLQIARHAAAKNPKSSITLDVVEDNKYCAEAAMTAWKDPHWPKNVKLNVTLMNGKGDSAKLVHMFTMKTEMAPALETKSHAPVSKKRKMDEVEMQMDMETVESMPKKAKYERKTPLMAHSTFSSNRVTRSMAKVEEQETMKTHARMR